jgi:hypothetical protein
MKTGESKEAFGIDALQFPDYTAVLVRRHIR